jgi:hypothetical protein
MTYTPGSIEWFAQVHEEVIEPELPIVDPTGSPNSIMTAPMVTIFKRQFSSNVGLHTEVMDQNTFGLLEKPNSSPANHFAIHRI